MVFKGQRCINRFTREICTIVDVEGVNWETKRISPDAVVVYTLDADAARLPHRWPLYGEQGVTQSFEASWPIRIVGDFWHDPEEKKGQEKIS